MVEPIHPYTYAHTFAHGPYILVYDIPYKYMTRTVDTLSGLEGNEKCLGFAVAHRRETIHFATQIGGVEALYLKLRSRRIRFHFLSSNFFFFNFVRSKCNICLFRFEFCAIVACACVRVSPKKISIQIGATKTIKFNFPGLVCEQRGTIHNISSPPVCRFAHISQFANGNPTHSILLIEMNTHSLLGGHEQIGKVHSLKIFGIPRELIDAWNSAKKRMK